MSERRIKASHPDYEVLNTLFNDYAMALNPDMFFNLKDTDKESPEYKAAIALIKYLMEEELKGGVFKDFLNEGEK